MSLDYPAHSENPIPYDGDADAWRAWVEAGIILREAGVTCSVAEPGSVVLEMAESPVALNPIGSVHGGVVAALCDAAAGAVFVTSVTPGMLPATASLTVEYHRPALAPLTVSARVTNQGRTLMFCEVDVADREGRLCNRAHAVMAIKGQPR